MSRKGRTPISLPKSVEVSVHGESVTVKGPKGVLTQTLLPGIDVKVEDQKVWVSLDEKMHEETHFLGLYRSLIDNLVHGVSTGFKKVLELVGVGYRAVVKGKLLDVQVGYSHPTELPIPEGIQVSVEKNVITLEGSDCQAVGAYAARIRALRPPEPYQGKGIRYQNEYIRRKAGKSASKK